MRARFALSWFAVAAALFSIAASRCTAEEKYYEIAVRDLKLTDGELPTFDQTEPANYRFDLRAQSMTPEVTFDSPVEGYLVIDEQSRARSRFLDSDYLVDAWLVFRVSGDDAVKGTLRLPTQRSDRMTRARFKIEPDKARSTSATRFARVKRDHYATLLRRDIAGAAWFRHQEQSAIDRLSKLGDTNSDRDAELFPIRRFNDRDVYSLFSGGRAISENLQLDRELRQRVTGEKKIPIDSLEGITIAEIDWKPLLKDANPKLDPLAKNIPADQHAVFFPSFDVAVKFSDEFKKGNADALQLAEVQSEDAGVLAFYQRQLGLPVSALARVLGGKLIGSVAATGSDPYFRVGADLAVLFEAKNPPIVAAALLARIQQSTQGVEGVEPQSGEIRGVKYQGYRTADRRISSYVAQLNGAVAVTNSLAQLHRLVAVDQGDPSLASLDEFKFFRHRYPLGDVDESAFVFLSDPTIRRWCSPQWRIGSARRTIAASELAELTARQAMAIGKGDVEPGAIYADEESIELGKLRLTDSGVVSSGYGSIEWMIPIIERPIDYVTKAEADSYRQWRQGYQRDWRWAFDPIGLRLGLSDEKLSADLTVMPLILGSEYRRYINITQGAEIAPDDGDRHGALLHAIVALNLKSDFGRSANGIAAMLTQGQVTNPLNWLGSTVSFYVDDDPIWDELAKATPEQFEKLGRKSVGRLPVALYADSTSSLKLTAFLVSLRAFIDQAAPGMTVWETRNHRDQPYVRISPTARSRRDLPEDVDAALYYVATPDGLTVTLSEDLLKRAIDRQIDRDKQAERDDDASESTPKEEPAVAGKSNKMPWLGSNLCLTVDRKMFDIFSGSLFTMFQQPDAFQALMQTRSWSNLPILNEWKRLFPDEDPIVVHERLWHTKLLCPGGGEYVWNDEWQTMESTVYGHPGEPKRGPDRPAALDQIEKANFGITFEPQGLRARMELLRSKPAEK